jgi:hypothetical protein
VIAVVLGLIAWSALGTETQNRALAWVVRASEPGPEKKAPSAETTRAMPDGGKLNWSNHQTVIVAKARADFDAYYQVYASVSATADDEWKASVVVDGEGTGCWRSRVAHRGDLAGSISLACVLQLGAGQTVALQVDAKPGASVPHGTLSVRPVTGPAPGSEPPPLETAPLYRGAP